MSEEKDVNVEMETPSESSTEQTTKETVTEDVKKSEESTIPKKRFDEVNAKYKELREKLESLTVEKREEPKKETAADSDRLAWIEFLAENRELDKEQLKVANRLYKAGVSLDKVLEDPLFVAFNESYEKKKVEDNSTPASSRSPKSQPEKPISEMTEAEHRAYFNKLLGK